MFFNGLRRRPDPWLTPDPNLADELERELAGSVGQDRSAADYRAAARSMTDPSFLAAVGYRPTPPTLAELERVARDALARRARQAAPPVAAAQPPSPAPARRMTPGTLRRPSRGSRPGRRSQGPQHPHLRPRAVDGAGHRRRGAGRAKSRPAAAGDHRRNRRSAQARFAALSSPRLGFSRQQY